MPEFVLHILKMNLIAAVILLLTELFSRLSRGRYAFGWKYWVWFAVAVFLLVPVKLPSGRLPQLTVNFVVEQPVKTVDSNLLAAQKEAEVSQQTSAQTVQQTFHSHEIQLKEIPFGLTFDQLLRLFGEIWLAGALFLGLVGLARYYLALHRLYRWSLPVDDEDILKDYQRLSREAELKKPPKLLKNGRLTTPVLAGLFHPAVYLTNERYEKQELCFILSHELTHYQRRDLWYKLLMQAVVSVYWFNPFLYEMRREAERTVENLCDARVVGELSSQERLSYSRLLLKTAAKQSHVPYLAAGLNDGVLVFKERIRYMRNLSVLKVRRFPAILLCAGMIFTELLTGSSVEAENNPQLDLNQVGMEASTQTDITQMITTDNGAKLPASQENSETEITETETGESSSLTSTPPANTSEPLTLYRSEGNGANYIYESGDGTWKDGSGRTYTYHGNGQWVSDRDGSSWTEEGPANPADQAVASVTVYDPQRLNQQTLYQETDGTWQNQAGGLYTANEDGSFTGPDGTLWTP